MEGDSHLRRSNTSCYYRLNAWLCVLHPKPDAKLLAFLHFVTTPLEASGLQGCCEESLKTLQVCF